MATEFSKWPYLKTKSALDHCPRKREELAKQTTVRLGRMVGGSNEQEPSPVAKSYK